MAATPINATPQRLTPLLLLLSLLGCQDRGKSQVDGASASQPPAAAAPRVQGTAPEPARSPTVTRSVSLVDMLPDCDVDDEGLVLDVGTKESQEVASARANAKEPANPSGLVERGGAILQQVSERRHSRSFWLDEPAETLLVRARVIGHSATYLSASVDGKRLGRVKLTKNEASTIAFARTSEPLSAGRHTLLLEAHGRASGIREPFYDLDWLNFSRNSAPTPNYSPPTARDLIADQELDSIPKRSIVLRSLSQIRCPIHLATNAQLEVSLGFWGNGQGTAEIGIIEEGQPKTTLHEHKVSGGVGARWTKVTLDLSPYVGRVVGLEFRAARATQGGRIAFGEPQLQRPVSAPTEHRRATTVVVLVAAGIERRLLPPWAPVGENAALGELLRDAVAFHSYRVPTTVPAGVLVSLLTGQSPARHRVEDTAARLGAGLHPLSQIVKQAGGRAAMFTAVPTTFSAFGFNVGWDDYSTYSPVLDIPAETPIIEAQRWLAQRLDQNRAGLRLLLVHMRGVHPPWDVTREQTALLPPADYSGALEARRGGVILGKIRRQTAKKQRRLNDDDNQRLTALMQAALGKQNAAIAGMIATLKRKGVWEDTLFIVAGDVSNAELPNFPFDPVGSLREDQLTVPLIVKFPGRVHAGASFDRPVTTVDLTRTILDALDLTVPETVEGQSLLEALSGNGPLLTRTLISTLGQRYVARTGVWLMSGDFNGVPRLCQTDIDPMCVEDLFGKKPLSARAIHQWTMKELSAARRAGQGTLREPASIDAETAAALTVWGDVEM